MIISGEKVRRKFVKFFRDNFPNLVSCIWRHLFPIYGWFNGVNKILNGNIYFYFSLSLSMWIHLRVTCFKNKGEIKNVCDFGADVHDFAHWNVIKKHNCHLLSVEHQKLWIAIKFGSEIDSRHIRRRKIGVDTYTRRWIRRLDIERLFCETINLVFGNCYVWICTQKRPAKAIPFSHIYFSSDIIINANCK